ncbi:MAG: FAD-binding oxidoreductase, partial [Acidobacteriota bacterium]
SNYITGLQVILADGREVRLGGRALDYPEYDFVGILTGSEGTLGIITEASVRLIHNSPAVSTLMVSFDSMEQAGQAVSAIIARGLVPATLEMMDQQIMRIVEDYVHAGLPVESAAALIIEADGYPESLSPQMEEITAVMRDHRGHHLRLAGTAAEREEIWYARKSVGGSLSRIAPAYLPVDGTVPRSKIAETLAAITQMCSSFELQVAYLLHGGDGNLHPHIFIRDPSDKLLVDRAFEAARRTMEICVERGGSITGEHGVGTEKREGMLLMYSAGELAAMREIKDVFDPAQLLNPGKIFPREMPPVPVGRVAKKTLPRGGSFAPSSTGEAADIIRAWVDEDPPQSIRIRGSGTKSGMLSPCDAVLSTHSLGGVLEYAPQDMYVTVAAGTSLTQLQVELKKDGMWVPLVSPWQASTVGGIVATNFNAPLRMRYGSVRDLVLAVTAILPDGRVIRAGRPVVKNVAGYDLTKLFVGSHGTLGLIADVTFKIASLPRAVRTFMIPIDNLDRGLLCASRLLRLSLVGSSILLCRGCEWSSVTSPYSLIYTAEGLEQDVNAELALVRQVLESEGITGVTERANSGSEIWAAWLNEQSPNDIVLRVGLAPKDHYHLRRIIRSMGEISFIIDVANGQIFIRGMVDVQTVRQAACEGGGYAVVLSAPEHARVGLDAWGYIPDTLSEMRKLKALWDRRGLMNPGAFI